MNNKQKLFAIFSLAALSITGCNQDSDDTTSTSTLSMLVQNDATLAKASLSGLVQAAADPVQFSDGVTTFTITEARMHIRDIRFDTINSDTVTGDTYTINGPFVMNLLDGSAVPADISFNAPSGDYHRIDIRLDEANSGEGVVADTDELNGNAMIIKGTHNYMSLPGTFTLTVKVTEDIRLAPSNGIIIDSTTGTDVFLNYRATDWLENPGQLGTMIALTACIGDPALNLVDETNHITLSEGTQCQGISESIGNLIKNNMKNKYDFSAH